MPALKPIEWFDLSSIHRSHFCPLRRILRRRQSATVSQNYRGTVAAPARSRQTDRQISRDRSKTRRRRVDGRLGKCRARVVRGRVLCVVC